MHASMTGWIKFSNDDSSFYKPTKDESTEWPPKFWKFILVTDEKPPCEAAFVDPRRLGRIRLLDCAADKIRQTPPLNANGPDPVQDMEILTKAWFVEKIRTKKVPVKAFLLDQANISGVGNWVGLVIRRDELQYRVINLMFFFMKVTRYCTMPEFTQSKKPIPLATSS